MESPQKKAGSMDGTGSEKTPLPHLLPVTVAKKTPCPDVVREVSEWVLVTAFSFAFAFVFSFGLAYALELFHVQCSQSSLFLRCGLLTDAEEAVMNALGIGMLCCVALQAAAAALRCVSSAAVAGSAVPLPTSRSRSPSAATASTPR
ncbi:hypothetical protein VPH35_081199 [Triticum aestivum]|uniref:uncharacterized protein n=1 Tax=Triticum aestivum TaxID=4565 RepID=UPI001D008958|nr:uncharacterized protein LOC123106431 [Triticum aestivum]